MLTNIQGLVDRLDLAPSKGLMPLFEAVSNAMDAIEEELGAPVGGNICIRLLGDNDLVAQADDDTLVIDGFEITTTARVSLTPTSRRSVRHIRFPR
ncbi:hypothetical protein [Pandoraea sp. SD6-2]|uniref:hypothetical protein n=1 Tax=Pandoraea sp. SD6-2 TaxID=1286093 RepID=UPI00032FF21A|nr:hypothetical protein [Pandoraea sp. SD6-2]EON12878.1 hypothetical protein C266_14682 [Pandoraea sp. SD6-2]